MEKGISGLQREKENGIMKKDFIKFQEEQIKEFQQHVYGVRHQFEESLKIKQNLPKDDVIVQMDFAENYSCEGIDDIVSLM